MQFDEDSILFNGILTIRAFLWLSTILDLVVCLTYPVFLPLTNVNIEDDTGCSH